MDKLLVVGACFVFATFASCTVAVNYHDAAAMKEIIDKGADPIAARCAVKTADSSMCAIYAAKGK